ncbi:MAG: Anti-sigma-28 factor, FlgM [Candidatus Atribacteria bacterium]|nr:Anti-sigma-28 factor, FlgM [Candidatus Atribacteria bacterium]
MKISRNQVENVLKLYVDKPKATREKRETSSTAEGDKLSLSSSAVEIKNLYQEYRNLPEIRKALVEEIQAKLQAGSYRVDSFQIAEKMVEREIADYYLSEGE